MQNFLIGRADSFCVQRVTQKPKADRIGGRDEWTKSSVSAIGFKVNNRLTGECPLNPSGFCVPEMSA